MASLNSSISPIQYTLDAYSFIGSNLDPILFFISSVFSRIVIIKSRSSFRTLNTLRLVLDRLTVSGRTYSVRSRFDPGSVPNLGTETR